MIQDLLPRWRPYRVLVGYENEVNLTLERKHIAHLTAGYNARN